MLGRINPKSFSHLKQYDYQDVSALKLSSVSGSSWNISPPTLVQIINDARDNKSERKLYNKVFTLC